MIDEDWQNGNGNAEDPVRGCGEGEAGWYALWVLLRQVPPFERRQMALRERVVGQMRHNLLQVDHQGAFRVPPTVCQRSRKRLPFMCAGW